MPHLPEIIFDAERMKYAHTGIYHYCLQLGKALLNEQANQNLSVGFYLPLSAMKIFGKAYCIQQHSLHKFRMPPLANHKLWHCTYQGSNYYPTSKRIKKVITIHDLNFMHEKKRVAKEKKYLQKLQQKIDTADTIVAISEFVKRDIEQHLDVKGKAVKVIYNGCNINDDVVAQQRTLPFDGPYFFTIGTVARKKNFHVLPACLLHNDYNLVIAGVNQDDEYQQMVIEEAKRLGVANRVHLIGAVSEAEKYWLLQNCSLFLFPSLAEGFGLPVIEAMRFGKTVVLSNATSLPEVGGSAAFYFDDFDPAQMAQKTMDALAATNKDLSNKIIEWSHYFSWQKAAKEYWELYQQLLK